MATIDDQLQEYEQLIKALQLKVVEGSGANQKVC